MSILDYFVTSFAEVDFAMNLICHIASYRVFDNSFGDMALYLMSSFELEASLSFELYN